MCVCVCACVCVRKRAFVGVTEWSVHFVAWLYFRSALSCLQLYIVWHALSLYVSDCVMKYYKEMSWPRGSFVSSTILCWSQTKPARSHSGEGDNSLFWIMVNCHGCIFTLILLLLNGWWGTLVSLAIQRQYFTTPESYHRNNHMILCLCDCEVKVEPGSSSFARRPCVIRWSPLCQNPSSANAVVSFIWMRGLRFLIVFFFPPTYKFPFSNQRLETKVTT